VVRAIPFVAPASRGLFEVKLLWLGLVLIYSFVQFTWSLRQFNYCCILIGAAPHSSEPEAVKLAFAERAARVNALGARSFNHGLQGHYLALASLAWFIHPAAFAGAVVVVLLILWRREFHSRTRRAMQGEVEG
jgi:uncharacterized membrane protein